MPNPKLPDSGLGWFVVIVATVGAMVAEYVIIKAMRAGLGK
jgi:hypothetical protein